MDSFPTGIAEAAVRESEVHGRLHQCPQCGTSDVVLEGEHTRGYYQKFDDGMMIDEKLFPAIVSKIVAIICSSCSTRFSIRSDRELDERTELMELKRKNAEQKGAVLIMKPKSPKVKPIVH